MPVLPTPLRTTPDGPAARSGSGPAGAGPLATAWGAAASAESLAGLLEGAAVRVDVPPAGPRAWPSVDDARIGDLRRQAAAERGTAWPQPLVSHYARYFRDGNRTAYEGLVAARQQRLTRAVVMALAAVSDDPAGTDAEAWLDEVIDGAFLLCEQSSWSWAAHDDVHSRTGNVVPEPAVPYLDLGAGEVAAQLAWIDHVLGPQLDGCAPGLRRRIRDEVRDRAIRPFLERLDWHWLGLDGDVHNWNPWIHSNLLAAALFLVEEPRLQAHAVARCIEGLDRFLASIPGDGAIDEGFAYWWNGAGRALEGLRLLEQATAGALDGGLPVVRALAAFPYRMHLGGTWFLNVADGPARAADALPWDMLRRWALRLGDTAAAAHAASLASGRPDAAAGLGRVLHSLLDEPDAGARTDPAPLPAFSYLPSVQIMVAREHGGTPLGLTLAVKGGHNGEHHNHRDVGSVVVAMDGIPLLVDAGQPTYTAQTFGPDRYIIRAMQSSWHNVPAPYGLEQGTGASFAATVLQEPTAGEPALALGLGAAYGLDHPEQWIRTALLNRDAAAAVIDDRWTLPSPRPGATDDVDITYLAAGTVRLGQDATATVLPEGIPAVPGGRGVRLRWKPATAVVLVDEWQLDDPLLSGIWGHHLTRLRFRMPAETRAAGAFTLTVEATP